MVARVRILSEKVEFAFAEITLERYKLFSSLPSRTGLTAGQTGLSRLWLTTSRGEGKYKSKSGWVCC